MFTFTPISKIITLVLGIALSFSQAASSPVRPNVQINTPTFTQVYDITADLISESTIAGPFGGRIMHGFLGGNVTDSNTGALVGHVISGLGGDFGVVSSVNAKLYTDLSLIVQWVDDKKFAFLKLDGIGSVENNRAAATSYARMETDSLSRQNLVNSSLLMGMAIPTATSPNATAGYFKLFAKSNPDSVFTGYGSPGVL
ncbi:hypothetical protein GYMLUDRAFT_249909 [Collybiopsis luxurians FD-317 M1]|uniref:Uncharacterized protein n=1 Tax=Collybiopsis luxurians FD-317 M1 TaxID=944289 RepID=A0A0D0BWH7_9AGAR|nr:hypothetical protein GYMLUDRAFT_249909 [Collybiopsis luxurians FD-317 M1]